MSNNQPIIVGVSGGVDSSVSALLLQQQGYDVRAVFMKNWEGDDDTEYCAAEQDLADASDVCEQLHIPIQGVNFSDQYWDRVFAYFLQEYSAGRTPNPDVLCNKEIKFRAFLDYALGLGVNTIATGHYVQSQQRDGIYYLLRGADSDKDQTYFLYMLNQEQLAHAIFPVGHLKKADVRKLARQHQLVTHDKKDSTGICFIGERDFKSFLQRYLPAQPGVIRTPDGNQVGRHDGLMYYTRGQRQGLGIGGLAGYGDEPWYVADKDLATNTLIVVQGHANPLLKGNWLTAVDVNWIGESPALPITCTAKTRYRQLDAPCQVSINSGAANQAGELVVEFNEPQWAITCGQSVVFYDGDICLGGGIIHRTEKLIAV